MINDPQKNTDNTLEQKKKITLSLALLFFNCILSLFLSEKILEVFFFLQIATGSREFFFFVFDFVDEYVINRNVGRKKTQYFFFHG